MIFISYSWNDAEFVRPFVRNLQDVGLDAWVDYQYLDLTQDIHSQLRTALLICKIIVLFESRYALTSQWVQYEQQVASSFHKRCVAVPVSRTGPPNHGMHLMAISLSLHDHR
jgi:hypothetical protein